MYGAATSVVVPTNTEINHKVAKVWIHQDLSLTASQSEYEYNLDSTYYIQTTYTGQIIALFIHCDEAMKISNLL